MRIISATLKPTEGQAHAQLHFKELLARVVLFNSLALSLRYLDVDTKARFLANSFQMVTSKGLGKSRLLVAVVPGKLCKRRVSSDICYSISACCQIGIKRRLLTV